MKNNTNGNAVEATAAEKSKTQNSATANATPLKVVADEPKPEQPKAAYTVDDLIKRNAQMAKLIEKRNKVVKTLAELESFKIAADQDTCQLVLRDIHDNEFLSSHSGLLKDVQGLLLERVKGSLEEVNAQILNF